LQAWLLGRLVTDGPPRAVGFEMLDDDDTPALAALQDYAPAEVAAAVAWADSGWPDFALYAPIFAAAAAGGAPPVAVHPTKAQVKAVMAGGLPALPPARYDALRLAPELSGDLLAALQGEVKASHCGHAPEGLLTAMVAAQQLKDAWMAERLLAQAPATGAALIAGGVHVRRDRGVPRYLARHGAGDAVIIDFAEVHPSGPSVADYVDDGAYDYVWFTPAANDEDPCERFREMLERMKHHHAPAGTPAGEGVNPP
jgi:uncharacterized iron-regulated protein